MSESHSNCAIEYRPIPDHDGYFAGSDGSIWSHRAKQRKQLLPDRRKSDGRARYTLLRNDGTYRRVYGSRFVLESFIGPQPIGCEACHRDGNCLNDSASNLRWDTHSANLLDRREHGTAVNGENINTAKLTEDQVRSIRARREAGETLNSISAEYGISATMVSLIYRRKNWQHVN